MWVSEGFNAKHVAVGKGAWPFVISDLGEVFWPKKLCHEELIKKEAQKVKEEEIVIQVKSPKIYTGVAPLLVGFYERGLWEYILRSDKRDNAAAENECQKWGGNLTSITDK